MTGPSLLAAAVDELYAAPLAEFITRRKALAAAAKKAGDRVAATAIGALRKPSLSADTVNRLVRGAPSEVDELLQLGVDLRAAEQALNAAELRRLGDRRRALVGDLADLAFELSGQSTPSPAVREEVTATLNAALADDEVAQRLASGALVTQARWDGFGSTQLPELAASMPDLRPLAPTKRAAPPARVPSNRRQTPAIAAAPAKPNAATAGAARERADSQRAAERKEAEERAAKKKELKQRAAQQAIAAKLAATAADATARVAEAQELVSAIDRRISELNLQLAHQRQLLADAQRSWRIADSARRAAALAASRAGAPSP